MLNKIFRHVNIFTYTSKNGEYIVLFSTTFDAFLHLPDLNVRPTQIYNICLKIKKKENMCAMKYVFPLHLWMRERERETVFGSVLPHICLFFKVAIFKAQHTKIPFLLKMSTIHPLENNGHTIYPIFRKLDIYTLFLMH